MLALLVVTAGCGGLGGSTGDGGPRAVADRLEETPTRTPTSTPTAADAALPPAVAPDADDGIDERALYLVHARALSNRSATVRIQRTMTAANGTLLAWYATTVRTNGTAQRYEATTGGENPGIANANRLEYAYWSDGDRTVSRRTLPNGTERTAVTDGNLGPPFADAGDVRSGRFALEALLTGADLRYVGVENRSGTAVHPLADAGDVPRLTVRVTSEGVIRSLVHRADTRIDGERMTSVTFFRTDDVGSTSVDRPAWAANTTPSAKATPTG